MEQFFNFVVDYWLLILVGLVLLIFINYIFRSIISILILIAFFGVLLVYGFNYSPDEVLEIGKNAASEVKDAAVNIVKPVFDKEFEEAKITFNDDGTYEVKTTSLTIKGAKGSSEGTVMYKDLEYKMDISVLGDNFNKLINQ